MAHFIGIKARMKMLQEEIIPLIHQASCSGPLSPCCWCNPIPLGEGLSCLRWSNVLELTVAEHGKNCLMSLFLQLGGHFLLLLLVLLSLLLSRLTLVAGLRAFWSPDGGGC